MLNSFIYTSRRNAMEELQSNAKTETDLSDSWMFVCNDDTDERNVSPDNEEQSDSESLEILEVERAKSEENLLPEDNNHYEEPSIDERFPTENKYENCESKVPVISVAALPKGRTYIHHPSTYINMWLSIVMVIAVAITLGLGIGHYLGSKRFARARDMIHHLQYENQMLERELTDAVMKHAYCENERRDSTLLYQNFTHVEDEKVCYADENPFIRAQFKRHNLNKTLPVFLQWFSFINAEKNQFYPVQNVGLKRNPVHTSLAKGDNSVYVNPFSAFQSFGSNKLHIYISKVDSQLIYLHSLLKKWGEFIGNVQLRTKANNVIHNGVETTKDRHEMTNRVLSSVSEMSSKHLINNLKNMSAISCNGCCRLKVNQCILHEVIKRPKDTKCKALSKIQLFCSLFNRYKNKSGNVHWNKKFKLSNRKTENKQFQNSHKKYIGSVKLPVKNSYLHRKKANLFYNGLKNNIDNINRSEKKGNKNFSKHEKYYKKTKHPKNTSKQERNEREFPQFVGKKTKFSDTKYTSEDKGRKNEKKRFQNRDVLEKYHEYYREHNNMPKILKNKKILREGSKEGKGKIQRIPSKLQFVESERISSYKNKFDSYGHYKLFNYETNTTKGNKNMTEQRLSSKIKETMNREIEKLKKQWRGRSKSHHLNLKAVKY